MNLAIIAVAGQISASPVISLTISLLVSIWIRMYHSRCDPALYSYSYNDLIAKQQWWKIFTAPFCQTSFLSLIFNVITLWGIRSVEIVYGSWYFLRYSLLLVAVQGLLTTWIIYLILTYSATQIALRSMSISGCSGIILSWISYQVSSQMIMNSHFYLMGVVPIPWDLAPIFIMMISRSKTLVILNTVSYFSGVFLYYGVLQVLPDLYWSACFIFNIAVFVLIKSSFFQTFLVSLNGNNGINIAEQRENENEDRGRGDVIGGYEQRGGREQGGNDIEMGGVVIAMDGEEERNRERDRDRGALLGPSSSAIGQGQVSWIGVEGGRGEGARSTAGGELESNRGGHGSSRSPSHSRYERGDGEEKWRDSVDEEGEEGAFEGSSAAFSVPISNDHSSRHLLGRGEGSRR